MLVCGCVAVHTYINLRTYLSTEDPCHQDAKGRKRKGTEKIHEFKLRNKPSVNEKQTANFSSPQLNGRESWLRWITLPGYGKLAELQVSNSLKLKCCIILGSLTCFKATKKYKLTGIKDWPISRQYHKGVLPINL